MLKQFLFSPDYNFFRPRYWLGQIDSRPLSAFRVLFALILLKDALYHFPLIGWFYTDDSILPRQTLLDSVRHSRFSLMDSLGFDWMVAIFFGVWVLVLVSLMLGYRTRLCTILNFIIILSVHERNIWILNGGDSVFRVLSFWMMFIPLGHYYSVDALLERWRRYATTQNLADLRLSAQPKTTFALFVRFIQMQFALIYIFTFIHKLPGHTWEDGLALHYALQLQSLTLPTGDWVLANFPADLLKVMTIGALMTEGSFFPLVFAPILQPYLRVVALTAGFMLHFGIAVLMSIGNFSNVMITGYLLFFESRWLVWLDKRLRASPVGTPYIVSATSTETLYPVPTIVPPPSDSWVWLVLALTRSDEIDLSEMGGELDEYSLLAYLPLSRLWLRFGFMRRLVIGMAGYIVQLLPHPLASSPLGEEELKHSLAPLSFGEGLGGRSKTFTYATRLITSLILLPLMLTVWWWNVHQVDNSAGEPIVAELPERLISVVQMLGLWQGWDMFSPYPSLSDGWIVIAGHFENDTLIDLRTGQALSWEQPRIHYGWNERWKKFESNVSKGNETLLSAWASYYCRQYDELPKGQRLATMEIHWRYRDSYAPGEPLRDWQEITLWRHWCYPEYQYATNP